MAFFHLRFLMASRLIFRSSSRAFSLSNTKPVASCVSPFFLSNRFYADKTITIKDFGGAETVQSGELQEWLKNEGEFVEIDEEIVSIATEKTSITIIAEEEGVVKKHLKEEGDTLNLGDDLFVLDPDAKAPVEKKEPVADAAAPTKETKETAAEPAKKKAPKKSADAPPPREAKTSIGSETRVKMSPMRSRIAERLKESQNTAAMLTTFQECDMSGLMDMRSQYKELFVDTHDVKLGFMSGFVKASTNALMKERAVNAYIDGNEIVYKDYVDINIAVATPTGLVTPVLRDCQEMSFSDIEKEIAALGAKARKGRITIADMEGGTFTISNGGAFGSMMGTPIINPPQSAILGMHGITKRAVVVNDQIVIRPMMYLALTYDHRLLDGKTAVTFLKSIKESVEDPRRLLLDL